MNDELYATDPDMMCINSLSDKEMTTWAEALDAAIDVELHEEELDRKRHAEDDR